MVLLMDVLWARWWRLSSTLSLLQEELCKKRAQCDFSRENMVARCNVYTINEGLESRSVLQCMQKDMELLLKEEGTLASSS